MLVGESGVGKTTLCQALLRRNRPHLRLPVSPCLGAAYLRSVLESRGCSNPKPSPAYASHYGTKNPSLQLFIDDIHAASCAQIFSELKEPIMAAESSRRGSVVSESVPTPLLLLQPFRPKQEKPHGTDSLYGKTSPALSRRGKKGKQFKSGVVPQVQSQGPKGPFVPEKPHGTDSLYGKTSPAPRRGKKGKQFKSGVVPQVQSQGPKGPFVPLHLLQGIETTLQGIIFSTDLYNSPVQQNLGSLKKSLYQEKDLDAFAKQLSAAIQWRQEEGDKGSVVMPIPEFAIFREGVCQLAHIYRALLLPGGHAALFGLNHATGRQTVARMAVHLASSQLFEVKPGGILEERSEVRNVLKKASFNTGILGESAVILVHEGIGGPAIDDLLAVMAESTFPGLYTKHELSDVVQKLTAATRNTRRELKPEQVLERSLLPPRWFSLPTSTFRTSSASKKADLRKQQSIIL
ncbi:UNVERIFIED_CONTAM: hypothetical protein FKN15_058993 [Acipenser sinensis]